MPEKYTRIVVRCEDLQQRCFIYRCLVEKGYGPRSVDIKHCPTGRGDAKQYVREQHAREVRAVRARPHVTGGVISMADADTDTVEKRKRDMDDSLAASGQNRRQPGERIAVLVPRRNIETWIHHLHGEQVNETDKYPKFRGDESACDPAARAFAARCPAGIREDDLPSLKDGCTELTRFFDLLS
jgi:hypothetical protein